jgi:hypothetical protein
MSYVVTHSRLGREDLQICLQSKNLDYLGALALPSHAPFLVRSASMRMSRAGSIKGAFRHGLPREEKLSTYIGFKQNSSKVLPREGIEN